MNHTQRQELKQLLETRRKDLTKVIADNEAILKQQITFDDSEDSRLDYNHPADMVQGDPDYQKEINLIDRSRAELAKVDLAISQIDRDSFGNCDSCEQPISFGRLKAIPFARKCIDCQEALEESQLELKKADLSSVNDRGSPRFRDDIEGDAASS